MSSTAFFRVAPLLVCIARVSASPQFPNGPGDPSCPDVFATGAAFKIAPLIGNPMTVPGLTDTNTVVGRSSPFLESDPADLGAPICSAGVAPYPNTLAIVGDTPRRPDGWPELPGTRREVHTEILSLVLSDGMVKIRAGQPYYDAVFPGGNPLPQSRFFRNSTGEVASNYGGNPPNFALDFPAGSFFNVFVEVEIPGLNLKLYNKTPLVLSTTITMFPPNLNLPNSTYIHDPKFGAIPLFDEKGLPWGWLLSAGHGSSVPASFPLEEDAEYAMPCPVSFCVDSNSLGLDPALTMVAPNQVFADGVAPAKPLTLYRSSSAAAPGTPPDMSNASSVVGTLGAPPAFAVGDLVRAVSFGRDGTARAPCPTSCPPGNGVLYFSVTRGTRGVAGTDVEANATFVVPEAAADVYIAAVNPFGRYTDMPGLAAPANDNLLAADSTLLGLRPQIVDPDQDNLTALELHVFNPIGVDRDFLYCTFSGPSFPGAIDTIYTYDPASGPFQVGNLVPYALAGNLGLVGGDRIDALAISDVTPALCPVAPNRVVDVNLDEILFSLAPGSPTLWGPDGAPGLLGIDDDGINGIDDIGETGLGNDRSPAAIFYSSFNGTFSNFALPGSLGLLVTDDTDAIDIKTVAFPDCNGNATPDSCDIASGASQDLNSTGIPDECEVRTQFCVPSVGGVIPCPCSNLGTAAHGCQNSAGTGGALLTGVGSASLVNDTVVFTSSNEISSALSIFLQGTAPVPQGIAFGDGVRCVGGSLRRLYVKNASGGTVVAPTGGDPSVSVRSAALGDVLTPGAVRYYQVYYRDPNLAFCPSPPGGSFNISNGSLIMWAP